MIINRKDLAKEKIDLLKSGLSAFAETSEVSFHIEKELERLDLNIHIDRTSMGSWFIPVEDIEQQPTL